MKNSTPSSLVSVIVPTVNRHDFLRRAIQSINEQRHTEIEVIVVDDASDVPADRDQLQALLPSCRLVLVRNAHRCGGAISRNVGISYASGEYVAFLDDDDIYYPNKISDLLCVLEGDATLDAVFGKVRLYDGQTYVERFRYMQPFDADKNVVVMNLIHNNATLIRRRVFESLCFLETLHRFQDTQFNVELSQRYAIQFVDSYVAEWRVDSREDKITAMGDSAKTMRDVAAFECLYAYLKDELKISTNLLGLYEIRLLKLYFSQSRYLRALLFFGRSLAFLRLGALRRCLATRRDYWIRK